MKLLKFSFSAVVLSMLLLSFSGCKNAFENKVLQGDPFYLQSREVLPEYIYKTESLNISNFKAMVFRFQDPANAPNAGYAGASILYKRLLTNKVFLEVIPALDDVYMSFEDKKQLAVERGIDYIITGKVFYYLEGSGLSGSRVDQEIMMFDATSGDLLWHAGAVATGKAYHDMDLVIFTKKGKAALTPNTLMSINAEKFCKMFKNPSRGEEQYLNTGYRYLTSPFTTQIPIVKYNFAKDNFKKALEINPRNALVHYYMGIAHEKTGDYKEAIDYYNKVLALEPDMVVMRPVDPLKKGYQLKKLNEEAIFRATTIFETMKIVDQAFLEIKAREYSKAEANLRNALKVDPDNPYAFYYLGIVYERRGDYAAGALMFRKVISLKTDVIIHNPGNPRDAGYKAEYIAKRKLKRMIVLERSTENIRKALIIVDRGEYKKAEAMLLNAIKKTPDNPHAYYALGNFYRMRKNYGLAKEMLQKAMLLESEALVLYAIDSDLAGMRITEAARQRLNE